LFRSAKGQEKTELGMKSKETLVPLFLSVYELASHPETGRARPFWDDPSMLFGSGGWRGIKKDGMVRCRVDQTHHRPKVPLIGHET